MLRRFTAQQTRRPDGYERIRQRWGNRNEKRRRKLETRDGEIELEFPRLRMIPLQRQLIDHYKRMERSLEESLVEIYPQGISNRRVTDITEQPSGVSVTAGRMSRKNQKVYEKLEAWRNRPFSPGFRCSVTRAKKMLCRVSVQDHRYFHLNNCSRQ